MVARSVLLRRGAVVGGCIAVACAALLTLVPSDTQADDGRYSLGTIQPAVDLEVVPGVPSTTWLGFYNIDGTEPTTVVLSVATFPPAWQVTLSADASSRGAGALTLTVEPSVPTDVPQQCAPAMTSLLLSGRGYVCADTVWLHVLVPEGYGTPGKAEVTVRAMANWPGQGAFRQESEFPFQVSAAELPRAEFARFPLLLLAGVIALLLALTLRRHIAKSQKVD